MYAEEYGVYADKDGVYAEPFPKSKGEKSAERQHRDLAGS